jgi:hypothetical protein
VVDLKKMRNMWYKLNRWFELNLGWFFINGRKQLSWAERLRSEEIEILIMESRIKSRRKK